MAELGQNLCTPARIYGPIPQIMFCGCSVQSFSVSAGWNEQASSLTIELVQDPCLGPRVWWNSSLQRQSSSSMADPGFTSPEPGAAAYFRIEEDPDAATEALRGGFEYSGLIESWNEKTDANGNPTYTVKMTDPRIILQNTQVIVNDYTGDTFNVWNLINAYGYVESLGTNCSGAITPGIGGTTFVNSIGNIANERGMVWNDLRCAIHTLTSSTNQSLAHSLYGEFCQDARLTYVGPQDGADNYGVIKKDGVIHDASFSVLDNANLNLQYYHVDLTEITFAPLYYRVSGPNISLMEIISQVCKDAGCDYYIELLPVVSAGTVHKIIKVRTAIRSSQPQMGKLDEFIAAKQASEAAAGGGVISYVKGEEVRNEETSIYLIGGEKRTAFEADDTQILPFWGTDTDGAMIEARITNNEYEVRLDLSRLNASLYSPFVSQFQWISETELRAAMGDMDSWKSMAIYMGGDFATWLTANGQTAIINLARSLDVLTGKKGAHTNAVPVPGGFDNDPFSDTSKDLDKVYEFVRAYSDEFYGKQFIVNADFVCKATDAESGKFRYSHDPSTEGCWVDDGTSTVIGLTHDSAASDFFRDESGKYQAIIKYPLIAASTLGGLGGALVADPSKLGDDNYITDGVDEVWVKAELDPRWVFGTPLDTSYEFPSFVLRISSPILAQSNSLDAVNELRINLSTMAEYNDQEGNGAIDAPVYRDLSSLIMGTVPYAIAPNAALCPTVSHLDTYGPWGVAGLPGQVKLDTDPGFVPWEYGSDVIMSNAASEQVLTAVTQMRKGERGSITVAGFPNIPLGAELFSVDTANPPTSQAAQKYVGTRSYSATHCAPIVPYRYCKMNAWTGEFGPNVTNISVSVGTNGFTTSYQFSTYTPQQGRFNKNNAERLRRIGQTRLEANRNLRSKNNLGSIRTATGRASRQYFDNQIGRSSRSPRSAHHLFIGGYTDGDRPEINTMSARDAAMTFPSDAAYSGTALMSLDGLFRPVSKAGDGGLPRFFVDGGSSSIEQPDVPVVEYVKEDWNISYLDPFANATDTLVTERDNAASVSGHDIEVLGRNSNAPPSGWAIPEGEAGGTGGYSSDYRFLALRGPVMIQSWGRDIDGKPIPNAVDDDTDAANGVFETLQLENKFLDNWLQKPKTWPVAPLDLVLDRGRGVWTTPQPPRIVQGSLTSFANNTGVFTLTDNRLVYDNAGAQVANPTVSAAWPWDFPFPNETASFQGVLNFPIYYDPKNDKNYILPQAHGSYLIKAPVGGILGRDGSFVHFATCTVCKFENSNIVETTQTIPVYNWVTSDVCSNGDRLGIANFHAVDGKFWIESEDCNDGN